MPKQYLTVKEVAKILGVSPLTIRNWDQKGKLVAYRNPMNNYRLYKIGDVEELLREIEQSRDRQAMSGLGNFNKQDKVGIGTPKFRNLKIETE